MPRKFDVTAVRFGGSASRRLGGSPFRSLGLFGGSAVRLGIGAVVWWSSVAARMLGRLEVRQIDGRTVLRLGGGGSLARRFSGAVFGGSVAR